MPRIQNVTTLCVFKQHSAHKWHLIQTYKDQNRGQTFEADVFFGILKKLKKIRLLCISALHKTRKTRHTRARQLNSHSDSLSGFLLIHFCSNSVRRFDVLDASIRLFDWFVRPVCSTRLFRWSKCFFNFRVSENCQIEIQTFLSLSLVHRKRFAMFFR